MNIFPRDSDFQLYDTGFDDDDILGRKRLSKLLSQKVDQIDDPIVWALDSRWGTGKSFLLKRWVGAHTLQNSGRATTVYFDAFASDYVSDPLVSLIAAVGSRLDAQHSGTFKPCKML